MISKSLPYADKIYCSSVPKCFPHNYPQRLKLSSYDDLDRVKELRASCDAILVGAGTIRKDNSALITRDEKYIQIRRNLNKCQDPIKVTLTRTGDISLNSDFVKLGNCKKIVYATSALPKERELSLSAAITLKRFDVENLTARPIITDLKNEGVKKLIVEGGRQILTMFFQENIVDELRLSIAPFFVGQTDAPRLINFGAFWFNENNRAPLVKVEKIGDVAVLNYKLKA